MATTMNLIAKQTVGAGGTASVTFSSIPQTYTDLKLVAAIRTDRSAINDTLILKINSTDITNGIRLYGTGSSGLASDTSPQILPNGGTSTANVFGNVEFYISDYASTTMHKTVLIADTMSTNNNASYLTSVNGKYASNTEVTSITLDPDPGNLVEGSTFYLYGISNSTTTQNTTVPYAYGGDVITTDGTYWYHAFKYSGSFVPQKNLTCDYLVVGGGGGGGASRAGAGGAGGYLTSIGGTALSLTSSTSYAVFVGAGGAGGTTSGGGNNGTNGTSSTFSGSGITTITAYPGGGGGGSNLDQANSGTFGSGGGSTGTGTGALGTAGQGNNGGAGYNGASYAAGGGGGAGAVGASGTSGTVGGAGGVGRSTNSAWGLATTTGHNVSGTVYYAGGGGGGSAGGIYGGTAGGAGGYGGGGSGTHDSSTAVSGTANTGGGGGGGGYLSSPGIGGAGGSGIVIVRYAV